MKSVLGYNEKPNCLVIDEIDGAPAVSKCFNFDINIMGDKLLLNFGAKFQP